MGSIAWLATATATVAATAAVARSHHGGLRRNMQRASSVQTSRSLQYMISVWGGLSSRRLIYYWCRTRGIETKFVGSLGSNINAAGTVASEMRRGVAKCAIQVSQLAQSASGKELRSWSGF